MAMPVRTQTAQVQPQAANWRVYTNPEVASHYASLNYLTPCETLLFDSLLKPGMVILDIGVGGGRTTPRLSKGAARYAGIDYSEEMIRICRGKFPKQEFFLAGASDLSMFPDDTFDVIVIAFNGLDYVLPDEKRRQCLQECGRVLRSGGCLCFLRTIPARF